MYGCTRGCARLLLDKKQIMAVEVAMDDNLFVDCAHFTQLLTVDISPWNNFKHKVEDESEKVGAK